MQSLAVNCIEGRGLRRGLPVSLTSCLPTPPTADVMCSMFNQLYDDDVVSDDTFYHWEVSGREDLEGREVALVVTKNFLQWLRSAGEEEGEGTGQ